MPRTRGVVIVGALPRMDVTLSRISCSARSGLKVGGSGIIGSSTGSISMKPWKGLGSVIHSVCDI